LRDIVNLATKSQAFRGAMRLVVDTGIHPPGWSRSEAIRYMRDNSAASDTEIAHEVDRYVAMPAKRSPIRRDNWRSAASASAPGGGWEGVRPRAFREQLLQPLGVLEDKIQP
jgi:hypothetical protein